MIIKCLKIGGKAAVVIPVGQEMNSTNRKDSKNLRQLLLRTCKIEKIIYLDKGTFENANVKTCILFFQKVKDYDNIIIDSEKKLNKFISLGNNKYLNIIDNDIINNEILYYYNGNIKYTLDKIKLLNESLILDYEHYYVKDINNIESNNIKYDIISNICDFGKKSKRLAKDGLLDGKYNFYCSSERKILKTNNPDYTEEYVIIGTGGDTANIK